MRSRAGFSKAGAKIGAPSLSKRLREFNVKPENRNDLPALPFLVCPRGIPL
jgi:hypothetical protein